MKRIFLLITALLFVTVAFSQTKTEIKPTNISKGLSTYMAKNFSGYEIDKAFKIDSKGVMSTQVMVSKGSEKLALTFDKDLKLTKKEAIKTEAKASAPAKK